MHVDVIPIKELTQNMRQIWLSFQTNNPDLAGPSFHPKLFSVIGEITPNLYVSVIYEGRKIMGFLPFSKIKDSFTARPIHSCYYQAIISSSKQRWQIDKILRKSGLKAWEFASLVNYKNIESIMANVENDEVACVDVSNGIDKYFDSMKQKNVSYKNLMYKKHLLERDFGAIRFVPHCDDVRVLRNLLPWKALRLKSDPVLVKQETELLERLFHSPHDGDFFGILSSLYAGDELVAGIFNLKQQGKMQFFITSLNPVFSKYSPGLLLLYYLILELENFQCKILDFGEGKEKYKWDFANSTLPIRKGSFTTHSLKERIKSINWLYHSLSPFVKAAKKVMAQEKQA